MASDTVSPEIGVFNSSNYKSYRQLISQQILFENLSHRQITELMKIMREVHFSSGEKIVEEGNFINSIFFIFNGKAKVIQKKFLDDSIKKDIIITTLAEKESIGFDSKGFFSSQWKHAYTIIALDEMRLLQLDLKDFNIFIKKHPFFDKALEELTEFVLKLDFLKAAYPFCHLNNEIIYNLAEQIEEISLPKNTIIFEQDTVGEKCYLVREGKIEVFITQNDGLEKQLAILESSELVGEAALLTSSKRNSSVRTLCKTNLLVLDREIMIKLMDANANFSQSVVGFMLNRFRPMRSKNVKEHYRIREDGKTIIILENIDLHQYYQLTEQTLFIWQQLDGLKNIRDLTVIFYKRFKAFLPDMICSILYNLAESDFVDMPKINVNLHDNEGEKTFFGRFFAIIKSAFSKEYSFTNTDIWLSKMYNNGVWLLYTWPIQTFFLALIVSGFFLFFKNYTYIKESASFVQPNFWYFLILLVPFSVVTVFFHEAAHAFTAKKLGYKVQRIGVGWFLFAPIAFTDTSSMWLANQKQRIAVDVAGIYVELIIGGILSFFSIYCLKDNAETAIFLWLFALFVYYNAFKNLSPIREYDGYFLMTNILNFHLLRQKSVWWLAKISPKIFSKPQILKESKIELYYWGACIVYLLLYFLSLFLIVQVLFGIFSVKFFIGLSPTHFGLLLSIVMLVFFVVGMVKEVRSF